MFIMFGWNFKIPASRSATALITHAPLKPLWGDGAELHSEESVLTLSVNVPKIVISDVPITEVERQLHSYYWSVRAATRYFPNGRYLIGRDGSMRKLSDDEATRLSGYLQVTASIDIDDLPYEDAITRQLKINKPSTPLEWEKNCVLLDVHAHGIVRRGDGAELACMVRFASRGGEIIVESF